MGRFIDEIQKTNSYLTEKRRKELAREQEENEIEFIKNKLNDVFLSHFKSPDVSILQEYQDFCNPLTFEKSYKNIKNTIMLKKTEFQKIYYKILNDLYKNFENSNKSPPNDDKLLIKLYIDKTYETYNERAFEILELAKYEILNKIDFNYNNLFFYENYNNKKIKIFEEAKKYQKRKKYAVFLGVYLGIKRGFKK